MLDASRALTFGLLFASLLAPPPAQAASRVERYEQVLQRTADHFGFEIQLQRDGVEGDSVYTRTVGGRLDETRGVNVECRGYKDPKTEQAYLKIGQAFAKSGSGNTSVPAAKESLFTHQGVKVKVTDRASFKVSSAVSAVSMPRVRTAQVRVDPVTTFTVTTGGGPDPAPYARKVVELLLEGGLLGPVVEGVAFTVRAEHADFLPAERSAHTGELSPSSITVQGQVRDELGEGVAGATVRIPSLATSTTSGPDGRYRLRAETEGKDPFAAELDLNLVRRSIGGRVSLEGPEVLPLPATSSLRILAVDDQERPHAGARVRLEWSVPAFVTAPPTTGRLDAKGALELPITAGKPGSLASLPVDPASLRVRVRAIVTPRDGGTPLEATLERPLNLALVVGTTVGPDMEPRPETKAPSLAGVSALMVLERWKDEAGAFRLLVHALHPIRKVAPPDWSLAWSDDDRLPLLLPLEAGPKPGQILEVGLVDVLTVDEHIERMRGLLARFAAAMPLTSEEQRGLQSAIRRLVFRDGSTNDVPFYYDNYSNDSGVVETPGDGRLYWAANLGVGDDPAYQIIPHELGHFLHHHLIEKHAFIHACYNKLSTGDHDTWKVPAVAEFKAPYLTFSESNADFFALAFRSFWLAQQPKIAESPYFERPGYAPDFESDEKAMAVVSGGTPGYRVEGVQTRFLRVFYGDAVKTRPAFVYNDYLNTMLLHVDRPTGWLGTLVNRPARTIYQWVATKLRVPSPLGQTDVLAVSSRYRLQRFVVPRPTIMPAHGQTDGVLHLKGKPVDFARFPVVPVEFGLEVRAVKGSFDLDLSDLKTVRTVTLQAPARIELHSPTEIEVFQGRIGVDFPATLITPGGKVRPQGTVVHLEVDDQGNTRIVTLEGEVQIESKSGQQQRLLTGEGVDLAGAGTISPVTRQDPLPLLEALLPKIALPPLPEPPPEAAAAPAPGLHPLLRDGLPAWALGAAAILVLLLLAVGRSFAPRLLTALIAVPLVTALVAAAAQLGAGGGWAEFGRVPELMLAPWEAWKSGGDFIPAMAWACGGLAGGMIMGGLFRGLLVGLLAPLAPWILLRRPPFTGWPDDLDSLQQSLTILAGGSASELIGLLALSLLGGLLGGVLRPRRTRTGTRMSGPGPSG